VAIIEKLFMSQEICWTSPISRDSIRIPNLSEKVTRYYVCSLKEVYEIFQKCYQVTLYGGSWYEENCMEDPQRCVPV
jgi:hypothetical protein